MKIYVQNIHKQNTPIKSIVNHGQMGLFCKRML